MKSASTCACSASCSPSPRSRASCSACCPRCTCRERIHLQAIGSRGGGAWPRRVADADGPGGRTARDGHRPPRRCRPADPQLRQAVDRRDRGYDPANVLAFQLVLPTDYADRHEKPTRSRRSSRDSGPRPDVESAGFTRAGLLIGEALTVGTFVPHGRTVDEMRADPVRPLVRAVSAGYLTAVGVRLLAGREFNRRRHGGIDPR